MAELAGKVGVVTGAASGIGRATAELFVAEGARVVLADVAREQGEALAEELGKAALYRQTDVSRAEEVQELVDVAVSHFGGLDVMFNNAGISDGHFGSFLGGGTRRPRPSIWPATAPLR